jgi:hypothetical protein
MELTIKIWSKILVQQDSQYLYHHRWWFLLSVYKEIYVRLLNIHSELPVGVCILEKMYIRELRIEMCFTAYNVVFLKQWCCTFSH